VLFFHAFKYERSADRASLLMEKRSFVAIPWKIMKSTIEKAQILRDLSKNPNISQREIALKNEISLGKVNYAIKSLVEKGYIKLQNFKGSKNKRKYMYILTPEGMYVKAKLTVDFFKWKMEEYERIKKEIEALEEEINGHSRQDMEAPHFETRPVLSEEK